MTTPGFESGKQEGRKGEGGRIARPFPGFLSSH